MLVDSLSYLKRRNLKLSQKKVREITYSGKKIKNKT